MALISVENVTVGLEPSPVHLCVTSSSEICMTDFWRNPTFFQTRISDPSLAGDTCNRIANVSRGGHFFFFPDFMQRYPRRCFLRLARSCPTAWLSNQPRSRRGSPCQSVQRLHFCWVSFPGRSDWGKALRGADPFTSFPQGFFSPPQHAAKTPKTHDLLEQ